MLTALISLQFRSINFYPLRNELLLLETWRIRIKTIMGRKTVDRQTDINGLIHYSTLSLFFLITLTLLFVSAAIVPDAGCDVFFDPAVVTQARVNIFPCSWLEYRPATDLMVYAFVPLLPTTLLQQAKASLVRLVWIWTGSKSFYAKNKNKTVRVTKNEWNWIFLLSC